MSSDVLDSYVLFKQSIGASMAESFRDYTFHSVKRAIDILGALVGIALTLPLMVVVAVLIKLDSPGPVFFMPVRVGRGGRLFRMYKFRTMGMYKIDGQVVHAHEVLKTDKQLLQEYKKNSYKLKNDPRITRVGKYLRKFSIDEFPQFFNVLKGDMSLVGPRAYLPNELIDQQEVYPETKPLLRTLLMGKP